MCRPVRYVSSLWLLEITRIPRYLANRAVITDLLHFVYQFCISEHFHEKDTLRLVSFSSKSAGVFHLTNDVIFPYDVYSNFHGVVHCIACIHIRIHI